MIEKSDIDEVDLALLDAMQDDIPLVSEPWHEIGKRLGLSSEEVISRLNRLSDKAVLKCIAPTLQSHSVGLHSSTLVGLRVPDEKIAEVADIVNLYPEVSHNYLRKHFFQLWFTITASNRERIEVIIAEIKDKTRIYTEDILELETLKKYKIDVRFRIRPDEKEELDGSD